MFRHGILLLDLTLDQISCMQLDTSYLNKQLDQFTSFVQEKFRQDVVLATECNDLNAPSNAISHQ